MIRLKTIGSLVKYMLKMSIRSKSSLFWNIVFPIILLTFIVMLFAPKPAGQTTLTGKTINVLIYPETRDNDTMFLAEIYMKYMNNLTFDGTRLFEAKIADENINLNASLDMLRNKTYDVVLFLPKDAMDAMRYNMTVKAKVYVLKGTPNIVDEQLNELSITNYLRETGYYVLIGNYYYTSQEILSNSSKILQAEPRLYPIIKMLETLTEHSWNNTQIEVIDVKPKGVRSEAEIRPYVIGWMVISIIFMQYMFGGILGGSTTISSFFEKRYLERIFSTKMNPLELFIALIITWIISLSLSSVICLAYGIIGLGARFTLSVFSLETLYVVLLMLVGAVLSISIGFTIGLLVRSTEAAGIIANLIVWPTMMAGGFWVPKFMLPESVRIIAEIHPLSMLMYAITYVSTYGHPITMYIEPIVISVALTITLLFICTQIYLRYVSRFLER